jgi:hypothetical protein
MNRRFFRFSLVAACVAGAASLSACGGGSGTNRVVAVTPTAPTNAPTTTSSAAFRFDVPKPTSPSAQKRKPNYVSSGTQSIKLELLAVGTNTSPGLAPSVLNVSTCATDPNNAGDVLCTVNYPVPAGVDSIRITTYAQAAAAGAVLSSQTLSQTIALGITQTLNFTLDANPVGATISVTSPTDGYVTGNSTAGYALNAASGSENFAIAMTDATGATIVGPGAPTFSVVSGTPAVATAALSGSTLTLKTAGTGVSAVTITASPATTTSGLTAATLAFNVTTTQYLPSIGAMPAASATSWRGTTGSTANATVVGVSTHLHAGTFAATTGTDTFTLGTSGGAQAFAHERAPLGAGVPAHPNGPRPSIEQAPNAATLAGLNILEQHKRGTPLSAAALAAAQRRPSVSGAPATENFWIQNAAIGTGGGAYTSEPTTLVTSTSHADIYVMNTLISSVPITVGGAIATKLGRDFENAYTSDTTHFASNSYPSNDVTQYGQVPYCDATGASTGTGTSYINSGRQVVVVTDPAALGSGVGGYFNSLDFFNQQYINCFPALRAEGLESNQQPVIYVGWFANATVFETDEDLVRGTAHEFQHLINYVQHNIISGSTTEDAFINEGLAVLAQDLAVPTLFPSVSHDVLDADYRAGLFLAAPQNFSLVGFSGQDAGSSGVTYNCSGCYGAAFLFQRYLYDRFGGDAYTHAEEVGNAVGLNHISTVVGEGDDQLIDDFAIAIANNGSSTTAAYALPGYPWGQTPTSQIPGYAIPDPLVTTSTASSIMTVDGAFAIFSTQGSGATLSVTATTSGGSSPFALGVYQY